MPEIIRKKTNQRMSAINICNGFVFLAGQVPDVEGDIRKQAASMLGKVDALLAEAGTDRARMLSATIFLKDMKDFTAFNEVWDAWTPDGNAPARACVQAHMARESVLCEVCVVAVLPG